MSGRCDGRQRDRTPEETRAEADIGHRDDVEALDKERIGGEAILVGARGIRGKEDDERIDRGKGKETEAGAEKLEVEHRLEPAVLLEPLERRRDRRSNPCQGTVRNRSVGTICQF